jgi:hypothetical protein
VPTNLRWPCIRVVPHPTRHLTIRNTADPSVWSSEPPRSPTGRWVPASVATSGDFKTSVHRRMTFAPAAALLDKPAVATGTRPLAAAPAPVQEPVPPAFDFS